MLAPQDARRDQRCRPASRSRRWPQLIERADLVIAIGGDGTLLYAAGLVADTTFRCSASIAAASAS